MLLRMDNLRIMVQGLDLETGRLLAQQGNDVSCFYEVCAGLNRRPAIWVSGDGTLNKLEQTIWKDIQDKHGRGIKPLAVEFPQGQYTIDSVYRKP